MVPLGPHQLDGAPGQGRIGGALGNGGTQTAPPTAFLNSQTVKPAGN
jgi:hypothetical protein